MAKLMSLAAVATAFLFLIVVDASVRTTVIIDEDTNQGRGGQGGQGQQQQCEKQIQEQDYLRSCQQFLWEKVQKGGRSYYYNQGRGGGQQSQHFDSCCDDLKQLRSECTCRGLERAIGQMRQDIQQQGQQQEVERWVQQAKQVARDLPGQCGTQPSRCQLQGQQQSAWF
uniref:Conlinin n=3 Tax=cellular organisms TaxID=131567 RepID=Q8LPD3_LINUS|nr:conlinin [Linum usitatissimum]